MTADMSRLDVPLPQVEADIARAEADWLAFRRRYAAGMRPIRDLHDHTDNDTAEEA